MNIREALKQGCEVLEGAGIENPRTDARALLLAVLGEERTVLVAHPERELSPEEEIEYNRCISERALGKPVSYITGVKEFMGLVFAVNEAVLIPRPETEVLVEEAIRILKEPLSACCAGTSPQRGEARDARAERTARNGEARDARAERTARNEEARDAQTWLSPGGELSAERTERGKTLPRVLDLCTGSGAIAISIKHFVPEAEVTATDLSKEALVVARENAGRLLEEPLSACCAGTSPRRGEARDPHSWLSLGGELSAKRTERGTPIRFLQGDLFDALDTPEMFDLIVSNPPYIPTPVIDGLMPDVKEYEPKMALDGGEDGLEVYRRLIPEAAKRLAPGGTLLLEIGFDQGETVPELCRQAGFTEIEVLKDLAGLDRVVRAWYNNKKDAGIL